MSLRRLINIAAASPWSRRREDAERQDANLSSNCGESPEESASQPLLGHSRPAELRIDIQQYGTAGIPGPSSEGSHSRRSSPGVHRRESTLNRVPEELGAESEEASDRAEEAEEMEWDLEERGLYPGSYRRILLLYSFVPLTSLLTLLSLAFAPCLFWLSTTKPIPHPPYYPFPLSEVILSSALWSLAYLLRLPLYSAVSYLLDSFHPFLTTLVFNIIHVLIFNFLRVSSLPIMNMRQRMQYSRTSWRDPVFLCVWWLSLGWAIIDVVVGISQSYGQIALYRNVMVPENRVAELLASTSVDGSRTILLSSSEEILPLSPRNEPPHDGTLPIGEHGKRTKSDVDAPGSINETIRQAVDKDLEQLVNLKEREDLEEIYGFPIIKIPVFVSCLQRIDSILLSTGNTLVLSASYLNSALSLPVSTTNISPRTNRPFLVAFPIIMLMNLTMSLLHTPLILPRIGVHTTAYIGFLLGLGSFFAGLGLWGALA